METVIRVAIIYVFVLAGLRVVGKREFSQMSPMELVALLLIPELVAQGLVREDFSITNALVAVSTLLVLVFLNSILTHANPRFETIVEGTPVVLAHGGQLVPENLSKERVTPEQVFGEMHKAGLERLDQVQWAVLETDGKIAIVPKGSSTSPMKRRNAKGL